MAPRFRINTDIEFSGVDLEDPSLTQGRGFAIKGVASPPRSDAKIPLLIALGEMQMFSGREWSAHVHSCWRVCIYHWTKGLRCDTPCSSGFVFIAKTGFVKPVTLVTVQESLCSPSQWQWGQLFELIERGISLFPSYLLWARMAATQAGGTGAERIGDTKVSKRDRPRSVSPTRVPFRLRQQLCTICTRSICCGQSRDFGARRSVGKNAGITKFDVEHRYSIECQRRSSVDRQLQGAGMGARDKLETTRRRSSEGENDRTDEIGAKR